MLFKASRVLPERQSGPNHALLGFGSLFMSGSRSPRPSLASLLAPFQAWSRQNLRPSESELRGVKGLAQYAQDASGQECFEELTLILTGRHIAATLQGLLDTGVLEILLPEVAATSRMGPQAGAAFKDVWEHTKTVVWQSVPRASVRWAALLHDVGKVSTLEILADGQVSFMDHERVSFEIFEAKTRQRIAFPKVLGDRIAQLVLHHQRPSQYESQWSDSAVRRLDREMGDYVDELLLLSRADITSKRPGRRKARLAAISELSRRLQELRAQAALQDPLPKGLSQAIMRAMNIAPGPQVGQLRSQFKTAIEAGTLRPTQSIDYYINYADAQGWFRS